MADDELWHVRMSHDDVKQLTLEQLDDLFRLEVIEADTLIWQPGMSEWLPLSVVAGLEEPDPAPVNIAVSDYPVARAKPMAQTQTSWPPHGGAPPSATPPIVRAAPQSVTPPPPSMRSAPAPSRSVPPQAAPATSWPPPAAWSNPPRPAPAPAAWSNPPRQSAPVSAYASTVAEEPRQLPHPVSVAPVSYVPEPFAAPARAAAAFSTAPVLRGPSRSGGGSWMILLALAAGAAVTLYRNDLVHAAARSIGQEGAYFKLETALGGPSFGTPRAVQQMQAAAAALTAAATADATPATAAISTTPTAAATATTTSDVAAPTATSAPTPTTPTTAASEPPKAAPPAKPAAKSPASAVAARPTPHTSSAAPENNIDPVFKTSKKGKKAKGNEYDPLNPSL